MDKDNVFCSNKFWMSNGDKLHVIIKDLVGTMPTIVLYDEDGVAEDTYWGSITALPATDLAGTGFTANWESVTDADGYYLDVSTDESFATFVTGYENLDVGDVTSYAVLVTLADGPYYYRISAYRDTLTSEESNVIEASLTEVTYGALYNWYAATDARNICSAGWHVPTEAELIVFYTFLDIALAGGKCKEIGFTYWFSPNTGATNEVDFNGRGSGLRIYNTGIYSNMLSTGNWWIVTPHPSDPNMAYTFNFSRNNALLNNTSNGQKKEGMALRPVKDSTTLTHGQTGTYTGNDGKVYRTICIGTQEWLADNLAETKYRNGDDIPIVTDNASWAALVTGAMCYYDNDESYA